MWKKHILPQLYRLLVLLFLFDVYLDVRRMITNKALDYIALSGLVVQAGILWFLYDTFSDSRKHKRATQRSKKRLSSLTPQEWLQGALQFYRPLGFFQVLDEESMEGKSDDEVSKKIIQVINEGRDTLARQHSFTKEHPFTEFSPLGMHEDVIFLQADVSRVWAFNTEYIEESSNDTTYEKFLLRWGQISRGVLEPTDVSYDKEWWNYSAKGPKGESARIERDRRSNKIDAEMTADPWKDYQNEDFWVPVTFQSKGKTYTIHFPHPYQRWYTGRPFRELNEIIKETGYEFVHHFFEESFIVVALTSEERCRIEEVRGFKFNGLEPPHNEL